MIPSGGSVARVAGLVVVGCILQISWLAAVRVLGATPDLVPLLVGAVALYAGAVPAATTGFFSGLLIDLVLATSPGASSLVLTLVGYGLGRYRDLRDPSHGLVPVPIGAVATAAYGIGLAVVLFLLDRTSVSGLAFQEVLLTVLVNAVLALPVFALVRKVLRPTLTVDPSEPRHRRGTVREKGPIGLRGLEV